MKQGLLASLTCLLLAACGAGGPTPTTSTQPTATLAALPTPSSTAAPTVVVSPTGSPTPTSTPGVEPTAAIVSWSALGNLAGPSAREDHTWTVDGDGSVAYLFGGRDTDGPSNDLWAFDLVSDEWTQLQPSGDPPAPRFGHTATWVPDVGLVVWSGQGRNFFDDVWAYDPLTDAWRQLPSLGAVPPARYGSCASLGPDGRLWISHGFTQDDGRFADTRTYDFETGEWTDVTPSGEVPIKRCLHDCFWSSGGRLILYGGQTTGVPALGDVWAYDPAQQAWTAGPEIDHAPRQLYSLAATNAVAIVFGGGSLDSGYLGDTWALDPSTLDTSAGFVARSMPMPRSGAALIADVVGDRALLFGGLGRDGLFDDHWELSRLSSVGL